MDAISPYNVVHRYEKRKLLIAVNCVAALSIFFFGYDQGMMGGVNNAKTYYTRMGFAYEGPDGAPVVTNTLLQGGINSVYYLGTLFGALLGGWFGDRFGRIRTIALGAGWGVFGACLQCSAQNHNWMICARLINGLGTGVLNAIVPVWATETSEHKSRGQFVAIEFTLNIFGVVVAYWLEYGTSFYMGGNSDFVWRFPIAFQIIPLLVLFAIVWFFPESPRWLVKQGRNEEARYILGRLRGNYGEDADKAESEYQDICNVAELEKKTANNQNYVNMLFGIGSGKLHMGRRVQLVIWLQIMQEWTGIAGVTIYGPTIYGIAGMSPSKRQWVAGLNDIFYTFSTLICVFTLDRIGRRWTLYWGSAAQGVAMALAGAFSYLGQQHTGSAASGYGDAATAMVYVYTFVFGATWLTVPWLYPAEIFPLQVRAKGNAWGVVGWSIGNGWLTLLLPVIFKSIGPNTFYIFMGCNFLTIPIVWALYPETNQRTLEEIDLLFASDSIWNWKAEENFAMLKAQGAEGIDQVTGQPTSNLRKGSLARGLGLGGVDEERVVHVENEKRY